MANRVEISDQNFMAYLERLSAAVGHADRHEPLRVYPGGRALARRAQERRADGLSDRSSQRSFATSVDASLRGDLALRSRGAHPGCAAVRLGRGSSITGDIVK